MKTFNNELYLTSADLQRICGLSKSTVSRKLRQLKATDYEGLACDPATYVVDRNVKYYICYILDYFAYCYPDRFPDTKRSYFTSLYKKYSTDLQRVLEKRRVFYNELACNHLITSDDE